MEAERWLQNGANLLSTIRDTEITNLLLEDRTQRVMAVSCLSALSLLKSCNKEVRQLRQCSGAILKMRFYSTSALNLET